MGAEPEQRDAFAGVLALKAFPELASVHADDLVALATRARERRYGAGARVPEAATGDTVLFLLEGQLREAEGERGERGAPALLGLVPVLAGDGSPAFVAESDVVVLEIAGDELLEVLEDEFELWLAALRFVCRSAPGDIAAEPAAPGAQEAPADPADLAERIVLLRRMAPFAGLQIALLGQIAAEMQFVEFEDGLVWSAEDPATRAIWVSSGHAEAEAGGQPLRRFGAGALIGLGETLAAASYGFHLRARGALRALELDGEALVDALEDDAGAAVELLRALARHSRRELA